MPKISRFLFLQWRVEAFALKFSKWILMILFLSTFAAVYFMFIRGVDVKLVAANAQNSMSKVPRLLFYLAQIIVNIICFFPGLFFLVFYLCTLINPVETDSKERAT